MRFWWFMAFAAFWHIFVYCPLAHYLFYYNGWLAVLGAIDFAGGMVSWFTMQQSAGSPGRDSFSPACCL